MKIGIVVVLEIIIFFKVVKSEIGRLFNAAALRDPSLEPTIEYLDLIVAVGAEYPEAA